MAKKNTADLGFEDKIWKAADLLRGSIDAAEYKNVVLGPSMMPCLVRRLSRTSIIMRNWWQ